MAEALDRERGLSRATRVVVLESTPLMGGVEHSTLLLVSALHAKGCLVTVVCPRNGPLVERLSEVGVEVLIVPARRFLSTGFRIHGRTIPNPAAWLLNAAIAVVWCRRLTKTMDAFPSAVVLAKGLAAIVVGSLATRRACVSLVWHLQDYVGTGGFGIYRMVLNALAKRYPDRIVCDGEAILQMLTESVQSKALVVLNAVDVRAYDQRSSRKLVRRMWKLRDEVIAIGNVARHTPWKGQHLLIEAFARLPRDMNTALILVGGAVFDSDTYSRRLLELVRHHKLEERVIFTGYRDDLPEVLSALDIFAYTAVEKDTSPLSLLSALAAGLPVVAFSIQGTEEVLAGEECGYLVPCRDVSQFTKALEELSRSSDARKTMGDRARETARRRFSLEQHVTAMEAVLLEVMDEGVEEQRSA